MLPDGHSHCLIMPRKMLLQHNNGILTILTREPGHSDSCLPKSAVSIVARVFQVIPTHPVLINPCSSCQVPHQGNIGAHRYNPVRISRSRYTERPIPMELHKISPQSIIVFCASTADSSMRVAMGCPETEATPARLYSAFKNRQRPRAVFPALPGSQR